MLKELTFVVYQANLATRDSARIMDMCSLDRESHTNSVFCLVLSHCLYNE